MFSGGGGAGGAGGAAGGGGLAGMMNAMGPMMGELLGGLGGGAGAGGCWASRVRPLCWGGRRSRLWVLAGSRPSAGRSGLCCHQRSLPTAVHAGARGRSARQLPANLPLEEALARAGLGAEDAARWKATLEADEAAQAAAPPQAPLSDAYLAALPPRAAAGLLVQDEGDEGDWTEGEEEEDEAGSGAAAAAQ